MTYNALPNEEKQVQYTKINLRLSFLLRKR